MQELHLETETSAEAVGTRRRLNESVLSVLKQLFYLLAIPVKDFRRPSHPRIVPDYSVLVLIAYVANPPLGLLACLLHHHTKNLFLRNQQRAADVLYVTIIIICHVIIGVTAACICITVAYYVIKGQHPPDWLPCTLMDPDFEYMEKHGLGQWEYCREKVRGNIKFDRPKVSGSVVVTENACTCD